MYDDRLLARHDPPRLIQCGSSLILSLLLVASASTTLATATAIQAASRASAPRMADIAGTLDVFKFTHGTSFEGRCIIGFLLFKSNILSRTTF